jgi:hypothetical protein
MIFKRRLRAQLAASALQGLLAGPTMVKAEKIGLYAVQIADLTMRALELSRAELGMAATVATVKDTQEQAREEERRAAQ